MKGDPNNPADWRRLVERDLASARHNLTDDDLYIAAFCLEQAAEKSLKGWLIGRGWTLVKTHDLVRLLQECAGRGCDLAWFAPAARRLAALYFNDRYFDESPNPDPEPDVAEIAWLLAEVEKLHALLFPPPPSGNL